MKTAIDQNSVFLVSGGAKGITAHCVIKLAQVYQCKFILLGRSARIEPDSEWGKFLMGYDSPSPPKGGTLTDSLWGVGGAFPASNEADLKKAILAHLLQQGQKPTPAEVQTHYRALISSREIDLTLAAVTQAGGQAIYVSADVGDDVRVQKAVIEASQVIGPITGLLHGAGILADKRIEKKSVVDFEAVYTAKVTGLQNLLACVSLSQLQQVILFSSVAGFYGNVGQTDYALANEILNKVAHLLQRHYPDCQVLSLNWGPWDGGMVTPVLKEYFLAQNIDLISIDAGTNLLANQLQPQHQQAVQLVIGGPLEGKHHPTRLLRQPLQRHRIWRTLSETANPFLRDHVIGDHAVLPMTCALAWVADAAEQCYPGFKFFRCENFKILKGIVFDGSQAEIYCVDLKEKQKTEDEIIFEALVWSQNATRPRYHYSTTLTLGSGHPKPPHYPIDNLSNLSKSNPEPRFEGRILYQNGTLFHGPSFQGIDRILQLQPNNIILTCCLPQVDLPTQGQFPVHTFNPFFTDAQFQALIFWSWTYRQAASLPLKIQVCEHYRPSPFDQTLYVAMQVQSPQETSLVADVVVHDAQGQVYTQAFGTEMTISPRLNGLFHRSKKYIR